MEITLDMCQYGTPWKKPTKVVFWDLADPIQASKALGKKCCQKQAGDKSKRKSKKGDKKGKKGTKQKKEKRPCSRTKKPHEILVGVEGKGFKTKAAQEYPIAFAQEVARALAV